MTVGPCCASRSSSDSLLLASATPRRRVRGVSAWIAFFMTIIFYSMVIEVTTAPPLSRPFGSMGGAAGYGRHGRIWSAEWVASRQRLVGARLRERLGDEGGRRRSDAFGAGVDWARRRRSGGPGGWWQGRSL